MLMMIWINHVYVFRTALGEQRWSLLRRDVRVGGLFNVEWIWDAGEEMWAAGVWEEHVCLGKNVCLGARRSFVVCIWSEWSVERSCQWSAVRRKASWVEGVQRFALDLVSFKELSTHSFAFIQTLFFFWQADIRFLLLLYIFWHVQLEAVELFN